mgnify:CR=1 FL=1
MYQGVVSLLRLLFSYALRFSYLIARLLRIWCCNTDAGVWKASMYVEVLCCTVDVSNSSLLYNVLIMPLLTYLCCVQQAEVGFTKFKQWLWVHHPTPTALVFQGWNVSRVREYLLCTVFTFDLTRVGRYDNTFCHRLSLAYLSFSSQVHNPFRKRWRIW